MDLQIKYLDAEIRAPLVKILSDMISNRVENQLEFLADALNTIAEVKKSPNSRVGHYSESCTVKVETPQVSGYDLGHISASIPLDVLPSDLRELITPFISRLCEWEPGNQLEQFAFALEEASVAIGG